MGEAETRVPVRQDGGSSCSLTSLSACPPTTGWTTTREGMLGIFHPQAGRALACQPVCLAGLLPGTGPPCAVLSSSKQTYQVTIDSLLRV